MIETLNLVTANAYLVRAARPVLVDTGAPGRTPRILKAMQEQGLEPHDLRLIVLTHGHSDHAGNAAELRRITGAPIAVHQGDLDMVRHGHNGRMLAVGLEAAIAKPFVDRPFEGFEPDIVLDLPGHLTDLGLDAEFQHTPGHSPGSISLMFPNGDAISGDLMRGGIFNGMLWREQPRYPYFLYDRADKTILHDSLNGLLSAGPKRFLPGHGGPIMRQTLETWLNHEWGRSASSRNP